MDLIWIPVIILWLAAVGHNYKHAPKVIGIKSLASVSETETLEAGIAYFKEEIQAKKKKLHLTRKENGCPMHPGKITAIHPSQYKALIEYLKTFNSIQNVLDDLECWKWRCDNYYSHPAYKAQKDLEQAKTELHSLVTDAMKRG